ncbi:unnamed protein product [Caenorhabditis bovis]|uniref:C2H2-type domain-containing protein n=1 Tax=Caenorhabditis bovis TaxID=2654633 RepID=A0A8S1E9E7_9PELO|nr:unnamed protein product [Caenorhabditis bovis]
MAEEIIYEELEEQTDEQNQEYQQIEANEFDPNEQGSLDPEESAPVCQSCNMMFHTWSGYEYHILKVHLQYKPFKCAICPTEGYHTELEGRHHMNTMHPSMSMSPVGHLSW